MIIVNFHNDSKIDGDMNDIEVPIGTRLAYVIVEGDIFIANSPAFTPDALLNKIQINPKHRDNIEKGYIAK